LRDYLLEFNKVGWIAVVREQGSPRLSLDRPPKQLAQLTQQAFGSTRRAALPTDRAK
jgi:hypothetical protein